MNEKVKIKNVLQISGAFIAWVLGAGFATGQEVFQFFSSYGYMSYAVMLINLAGFIVIGYFIMRGGYENKAEENYNHFVTFCGKKIGTFYTWLTFIILLFLLPVHVAGAGATLLEYYGIDFHIGSAIMTLLVLAAYLIGFDRMIKIISSIGPIIIVFSLIVGAATVFIDAGKFNEVASYESAMESYRAAPHWALSGVLYISLNFFPGSAYYSQLGHTAGSKKDLKYGAVIGGILLIVVVFFLSTAILLNGNTVIGLDIPVLYLARRISYPLGAAFSVILLLGIFSSCSVKMWAVCSCFKSKKKYLNVIAAVAVSLFAYLFSLESFNKLVSIVFPITGYIGLFFIGCVIYKGICEKNIPYDKK